MSLNWTKTEAGHVAETPAGRYVLVMTPGKRYKFDPSGFVPVTTANTLAAQKFHAETHAATQPTPPPPPVGWPSPGDVSSTPPPGNAVAVFLTTPEHVVPNDGRKYSIREVGRVHDSVEYDLVPRELAGTAPPPVNPHDPGPAGDDADSGDGDTIPEPTPVVPTVPNPPEAMVRGRVPYHDRNDFVLNRAYLTRGTGIVHPAAVRAVRRYAVGSGYKSVLRRAG